MKTKTMLVGAALLALADSSFATSEADQVARLEFARQRMTAGAHSVKPNQASRMRAEASKLQDLIDRLETGEDVELEDIDRAIQRTYQSF